MSYNGYTNEDSYFFDLFWANDRELYEAIKSEGKRLLAAVPGMSDQTLGLNVLAAIKSAEKSGGWGWPNVPASFANVPKRTFTLLKYQCDLANVDETEFGEKVREAVETE